MPKALGALRRTAENRSFFLNLLPLFELVRLIRASVTWSERTPVSSRQGRILHMSKMIALIPVALLAFACGGGEATPEAAAPEAPAAAPAADAPAAGDAAPAGDAKPAEGGDAKPADAPAK